jgi:hypothetical protein
MKTFKRYESALKAAEGKPIIRIMGGKDQELFLVIESDLTGIKLTEVSIISGNGYITGNVIMGHLDRLGNANHATPADGLKSGFTAFPKES